VADPAPRLDLARLVADHHGVLYRYAFRLTGSAPDAEDLTQQTFLVAQQKLGQLRDAENARAWLFTVLRNGYLKSFRKAVPQTAASIDLDVEALAAEETDEPFDRELLQRALDQLPDDFRLVVVMFYFEERSYREIAAELEVPIGTVMSRLARAKAGLRRLLHAEAPQVVLATEKTVSTAAEKTVSAPSKRPMAAR
jgi:RNA polymerase sigma-70 factor (ECF subfamily)